MIQLEQELKDGLPDLVAAVHDLIGLASKDLGDSLEDPLDQRNVGGILLEVELLLQGLLQAFFKAHVLHILVRHGGTSVRLH